MSFLRTKKLHKKIIYAFVLFFLSFLFVTIFSYFVSKKAVTDLVYQNLNESVDAVYNVADVAYSGNIRQQKDQINLLYKYVEGKARINNSDTITVKATDQITNESSEYTIPTFTIDGNTINNRFELVEKLSSISGEAVTIFQIFEDGLLRISTTVQKTNGARAIGTYIPKDSPVYKAITTGNDYFGRAFVVNRWFIVGYRPIKDHNNKIIGALFIGFPDNNLDAMREVYHKKILGKTGYIYVLNSKGELVIHPKLEGKNIIDYKDDGGHYFIKEICEKKNGTIVYPWKNPGESRARNKIVIYKYLPEIDWIVAAGAYLDEFYSPMIFLRNFVFSLLFVFSVLLIGVFLILYKSIKNTADALTLNASTIYKGSQEISKSNMDLAARTQEQASSLEETASTVEEITSTVKQTSDNAQRATQLVGHAVDSANEGTGLSEHTHEAMKEISKSSSEIAEIVNLVNEIAFQTNILAINAAIEAAKAGEQGKGFAVVAIEVRSLAQRSAEAAKEIKDLILKSIEKVTNGNQLVENNAIKLKEIALGIQQVSDIVREISTASKEQYNAIEQINKALAELDSVTQQNSALVEETASASENMASETEKMLGNIRETMAVKEETSMQAT